MEELRKQGKALGIKGYHNMKEDNLRARIAEKTRSPEDKPAFSVDHQPIAETTHEAPEGVKNEEKLHDERKDDGEVEGKAPEGDAAEKTGEEKVVDGSEGDAPVVTETTTWLYHATETPKIFQVGAIIPPGWNNENRRLWDMSGDGKWTLK